MTLGIHRAAHDRAAAAAAVARREKAAGTARLRGIRRGLGIVQRLTKRFGCRVGAHARRPGVPRGERQESERRHDADRSLYHVTTRKMAHVANGSQLHRMLQLMLLGFIRMVDPAEHSRSQPLLEKAPVFGFECL
jgi:hypothetical protein